MKTKVIALLLSIVLASGSIGTAPVYAAEADLEESVPEQEEEEKPEEEEALEQEEGTEEDDDSEITEGPEENEEINEVSNTGDSSADEDVQSQEEEPEETSDDETEDATTEEAGSLYDSVDTPDETEKIDETDLTEEELETAKGEKAALDGDVEASGKCGASVTWKLISSSSGLTLVISGTGEMYDYYLSYTEVSNQAPWGDYNYHRIKDVIIQPGVTSIGAYAFWDCYEMSSISIPSSVNRIGESAFAYCDALTNITIPDGITQIENETFSQCYSLTGITLPKSLMKIGNYAFLNCKRLQAITIPKTVTNIGEGAFADCGSLNKITFLGSAPANTNGCFRSVTATAYYPEEDATWTEAVRRSYGGNITWTPVETIVSSGNWGDNVNYKLTGSGNDLKLTISGSGKMKDTHTPSYVPWYNYRDRINNVIIKDGVKSIGETAFWDCKRLTSITLPASVTAIGSYAFYACSGLETINIPYSVEKIENCTFGGCTSLKSISIPNNVKSIGARAMEGCSLETITIPASVTSIEWYAFCDCYNLRSIRFLGKAPSMEDDCFCYVNATAYFRGEDTTWTNAVKQNYGGTIRWVPIKAANKITAKNFTLSYSAKQRSFSLGAKATGGKLTYKSNKTGVKVDSSGKVTIGAKFSGTAKITITAGNANYQTVTKTITITIPVNTAISKVASNKAGTMTVTWAKKTSVTGYQIQYSRRSDFSSKITVTIGKNTTVSKTLSKLTKGKKYYVRIRTYKKVGTKMYYSAWSAKKTITIKSK